MSVGSGLGPLVIHALLKATFYFIISMQVIDYTLLVNDRSFISLGSNLEQIVTYKISWQLF